MQLFWFYKSIFTLLSIGIFIFNLRRTYLQLNKYNDKYKKLPEGVKKYIKKVSKNAIKNALWKNKGLIVLNTILLILLITINILVWVLRF